MQFAYEHLLSMTSRIWSLSQYSKALGFEKRRYASFYNKMMLLEEEKNHQFLILI
jgi:hypothetical protein